MKKSYRGITKGQVEVLKEKYQETQNSKYRRKLYHIFLDSIDDLSRSYIRKCDEIIDKIQFDFMGNGGWTFSRKGASNFNSKIYHTNEGLYSTYSVKRDINGFHLQPEPPAGSRITSTREEEERFLRERRIELDIVHRAMLMKDDIIVNRRYTLKYPENAKIIEIIREFFDFNNREATILPPTTEEPAVTGGTMKI